MTHPKLQESRSTATKEGRVEPVVFKHKICVETRFQGHGAFNAGSVPNQADFESLK